MATQLEQLLTCCICLDRFRNPKLLPCQHSVCMEPCMEGLVDYVRRQVKCPECRAEHRIPYNGVQGFPTNVTLQRFLEAHIEITGETPDPYTGQVMERCAVCNEKNYLSVCAHCEKKVCVDCKSAHSDILKREIGRINNQVKRASHRLADHLSVIERNITALKYNTRSVTDEVENISRRLQKSLRDRCDFIKSEVENYYNTELRNMTLLKEGLEQEIANVDANTDLAEKHMDDLTPWDDCELMDTKEIFLRTMEFIRSFDYDAADYTRRARFDPPEDLNKLADMLGNLGDLVITPPKNTVDGYTSGHGLSKSKSDHRLAVQFRDQDEGYGPSGYSGRTSPMMKRRFGERNLEKHDGHDSAYESPTETGRRRFRSRFMRREEDEERSVRFNDDEAPRQRPKVIDTEDVSRGPLSGITRLYDSPRVMKRLQEREQVIKKKKEAADKPQTQTATRANISTTPAQRKTSRQVSEDEIDKIKKQNKTSDGSASAMPSSSAGAATPISSSRPAMERLSSLKDEERQSRGDRSSVSPRSPTHSPSSATQDEDTSRRRDSNRADYGSATASNGTANRTTPSRKPSIDTGVVSMAQRSYPFSRSSSTSSVGDSAKTSGTRSPKPIDTAAVERRLSRSNSTDSNKSVEDTAPVKNTGAAFSTDELRSRFARSDSKSLGSKSTTTSSTPRYQSRFLGRAGTPSVEASKESGNEDDDEEEESSEESESEESEESSEEEEDKEEEKNDHSRPDTGLLLGRSAQSRDTTSGTSASTRSSNWNDRHYSTAASSNSDSSGFGSRYGISSDNSASSTSSRYGTTSSSTANDSSATSYRRPSFLDAATSKPTKEKEDDFDTKYSYASKFLSRSRANAQPEEETKPPFQSRFLNRSKSSAVLGPDPSATGEEETTTTSGFGASRARFEEMKERRQRLARSKSSAGVEEEESGATADSSASPATPSSTVSTYRSRFSRDSDTTSPSSTSRTTTVGTTGSEDSTGGSSSSQLSNWARYLKNKYGKTSSGATTSSGVGGSTSSSTTATSSLLGRTGASSSSAGTSSTSRAIARSRSSHLLGLAKDGDSSEDDSKNVHATPTSPVADILVPTPFGSIHRTQYLQKQNLLFKIGGRGSEPGKFTWPRGVAVGPDNSIVVADSSNHRVQVFDQNGNFIKEFGSYGSGEGEFDCLAGVAVNRIGQYIIADRYNHRIQVFDPSGMFLRSFGSQGSGDRRFSYPWGVTTDALGFIYVCDKENHRIQVFQSDGTFVGKFGTMGNKPGQLEHPHYIAVSSTNRVIVSDSNNHRIQIFDINGKVITTFGSEGSGDGQFKFPRGVAVDDQAYILVADSGNNRIQIFHPDGTFLRTFGCWGSGDGEFKGLEGMAVMSNGNILVCDRENHRIQVF